MEHRDVGLRGGDEHRSPERSTFSARWDRYGLGPIDINNFRTAEQTISRTAAMVRRHPDEVYALSYMQQGSAAVRHAGSTCTYRKAASFW
jgi:hypothetical protein